MAHYECELSADVDALVAHLDKAILSGSISANLEESYDHTIGQARMVVRIYERYSAMGGNRVSLNVSVLVVGQRLAVSMVTAGGSQAVFWKLNTFGEEAFLNKGIEALAAFAGRDPRGPSDAALL